jgi:hypothetical protein
MNPIETRPIPGGTITKRFGSAAEIQAEIARRIRDLRGNCALCEPPGIVEAHRGYCTANWKPVPTTYPDGCSAAVEGILIAVMLEWEMG